MGLTWRNYLPLKKNKSRQEMRMCIVEGTRLCQEALTSGWEIEAAFATEAFVQSDRWTNFEDTFRYQKIEWRTLSDGNFNKLADTDTPQGILMVMRIPETHFRRPNWQRSKFVLALEGIRDPGNMGTLIRSADWYGVDTILLSPDCVDAYNPKVLRGSMGSIFRLRVFTTENFTETLSEMKTDNFWLVAGSLSAKKILQDTHFRKPVALILGNEAHGISMETQRIADLTVKIWKFGQAESLNVGTAGSVFLHHIAGEIFERKTGK